ncbi:VOC family protein [Prolixibacteraceae bacterium Z1-6]|uniref:VOC family protein n=1 Tax=Draconibacterium aestuarii TaxID=2998507 RepID=A0A9X3FB00_9BACT|nr:VOC family protein [Prolixibacteraceae bacterium Z1-6]
MKKSLATLVFIFAVLFSMAQSNFSHPGIFVGNVVEDLDKSVKFYTEVIGMTKTGEFSVDKEKATELGLTNQYQLDVTILKLEDSPNATEWKLMSVGTKAKHPKQKWMTDDTGMQYITILVNHIDPIIERCKKHNVKILSGIPSGLGDGRSFILVQDPDGTFIEMIGQR